MKLPRNLRGADVAQALCKHWDYVQVHQSGSHIVLDTQQPHHHRLVVPAHKTLKIGTLNSILRAVSQHKQIRREQLLATLQ